MCVILYMCVLCVCVCTNLGIKFKTLAHIPSLEICRYNLLSQKASYLTYASQLSSDYNFTGTGGRRWVGLLKMDLSLLFWNLEYHSLPWRQSEYIMTCFDKHTNNKLKIMFRLLGGIDKT
jgi:hypothetical protein